MCSRNRGQSSKSQPYHCYREKAGATASKMRARNKPSAGYSTAAPPGHRPSHLDLSSSHAENDEPSSKIHKKSHRGASKSKIFATALCSLVALGTLIYVGKLVANGTSFSLSWRNGELSVVNNIHHITKHHPKHTSEMENVDASDRRESSHQTLLPPDSIYRTTITDIRGTSQSLMQYAGFVSLIVNVACE